MMNSPRNLIDIWSTCLVSVDWNAPLYRSEKKLVGERADRRMDPERSLSLRRSPTDILSVFADLYDIILPYPMIIQRITAFDQT
jgi:hypothetical protein